jgi:2-polyprenyl-3-methyl-5-hydroxy-6-metoxy-1,4-benzoquinol methylase
MNKAILTKENFDEFRYSKRSHFESFAKPTDFFNVDMDDVDLKCYQDLFIYNFLLTNLPRGSKILEVGGGNSRIFRWFSSYYDITILDKFEGNGNGPQVIPEHLKNIVIRDYLGSFNNELKNNSFDCVFSLSVLEHIPFDSETMQNVTKDIERLLKPNGISVHVVDCVLKNENNYWKHPIVDELMKLTNNKNTIQASELSEDKDFYYMSEKAYNKTWKIHTKKSYCEHGKAFSVNIIYQK